MTSRPPTRLRAQTRPQAGAESTTGQPRGALTRPLRAPAGKESTTSRAETKLRAHIRPQAGGESPTGRVLARLLRPRARLEAATGSTTGQPRGALTGRLRARPMAGGAA